MTRQQVAGLLLALSILGNGLLLGLWWRGRAADPATPPTPLALALVEPSATSTVRATAAPTADDATPTRRPGPLVATRATTAAAPTRTTAPSPTPTAAPATDTPATPTEEPTAAPSPTPTTAPTAEPPASPTIAAVGTDWLQFVNRFRASAGVPPLLENTAWSLDAFDHSRYMAYTGDLSHSQDVNSPYFSRTGMAAAENSNIAAGYSSSEPFQWAFNYWMSAPFHALPIIDPQLAATGFAEYRSPDALLGATATLDVRRGLGPLPAGVVYPIRYPGDGASTWVLRYSLPEFPEALSTCPGYQQPTGAPIILQLGDGSLTPHVTATSLARDGQYLAHCWFDETTFTHPNEFRQRSARTILDQRDAIVIIPQEPLLLDATYAVRIDANGQTYTWSFHTVAGPP
ncbi:MAG: CAP domain-containing protein [Anaerolineae bacterium]|nr:CAP domain-containing protein [Anaerolineae bacterium]